MATHEIKADLDVDGEVQGTSLDINGNADISGQLLIQNGGPQLVLKDTTDDDDQQIQFMNNSGGIDYKIYTTDFTSGGGADGLYIGSTGSDEVGLVTNNTTALTLDTSQNATFAGNVTLSGIILDGNTITGVDDSGEFTDNDAHIMTSAGINDRFAQINANTTGSSGSCTGNSATATDATNLNATDDRDMAPEDYGYSNDFRIFFTSKEGLEDGSSTSGNWMDALYLNSYSDASGHDANLLAFDKSTKAIYHYQADQAASNWGTAKQLAYTDSDISGDTTGTAAIATTITVADESSDTSCNVLFATAATGNLGPKSGTNLTFNSSSGVLTATGFAGALTGNVTGNASGSSGSCTGNSATATALTSGDKTISGNVTINGFVLDGNTITGIDDSGEFTDNDAHIMTSAGINDKFAVINANTTGSSGSCTGNAATATTLATARNIGGVSFNGSAAINLPGVNTSGNQDTSGTAALATAVTVTANNSESANLFPVFVDGASGTQGLETDSGYTYNPSSGVLTTQKLSTDVAEIVENNKDGGALMTLTGQGAGNEANICLKMIGTQDGNPIKMKMVALNDNSSQVGAGILSYDAEDDSFGIGQNSSHNRMAIKMENTITSPVDGSTYVYYEPTSIKAREYIITANSTHYDFYGDIMRNGNDTTVRGKMYCFKNGTWTITNADTKLDANGLLGIALGTNSTTHGMLLKGTFTLDYDPGGIGNPLYISTTDGLVSTTVPSTSGHIVRLVGYLVGGAHGNLWFNPDSTYVEVA